MKTLERFVAITAFTLLTTAFMTPTPTSGAAQGKSMRHQDELQIGFLQMFEKGAKAAFDEGRSYSIFYGGEVPITKEDTPLGSRFLIAVLYKANPDETRAPFRIRVELEATNEEGGETSRLSFTSPVFDGEQIEEEVGKVGCLFETASRLKEQGFATIYLIAETEDTTISDVMRVQVSFPSADVQVATAADPNLELIEAAIKGQTAEVQALLDARADVDTRGPYAVTPLIVAASEGHSQIVRLLLKAGADVDMKAQGGVTALLAAAGRGHTKSVRLLLEAGADMNARSLRGRARRTRIYWDLRGSSEENPSILPIRGVQSCTDTSNWPCIGSAGFRFSGLCPFDHPVHPP